MKTVKVRIAVQVGPKSHWNAEGDSAVESEAAATGTDAEWDEHNTNFPIEHAKRYWVTAELPVPEAPAKPETVVGTVTEAA